MFIFFRKDKETGKVKKYLSWGFHELAWSIRTSGYPMFLLDDNGNEVERLYTVKRAGNYPIPETAKWLLRKYCTNSGYCYFYIYKIPERGQFAELEQVAEVYLESVKSIYSANVPEPVKEWILNYVFGDE